MLSQTKQDFRTFFLLEFTKELIRHSKGEIFILDNTLKKEEKELKNIIKEKIKKPKEVKEFKNLNLSINREKSLRIKKPAIKNFPPSFSQFQAKKPSMQILRIPKIKLPPRLQYLRPIPKKVEINLGKLNSLAKDPMVKVIQCNGPGENIIVEGSMGRKSTEIILSKEEINEVIKKFSEISKIPADEGIVRIVVGRLNLLAVISDVVSTKFLIKKISHMPNPMMPR